MPKELGRPSRHQREAYSRRRKPTPLRVKDGRQEAQGRKRPLKQATEWLRDEGLGVYEDEGAIPCVLVRRR